MPTYVYRREDGSTFEIQQKITEPPLEKDPETGQAVTRVISGSAGLIFKGSGFYLTDYARKNSSGGSSGSSHSSSGGNGASTTSGTKETSTKTESKTPAAKE